jgi:cytochrome c553
MALLIAGLSAPLHASLLMGEAERGKQLHDKLCASCHKSMFNGNEAAIFTRSDRRVHSVEGLMAQVEGCNANLGTQLDKDAIDDLVKYLNDEFYKFD